MARHLTTEATRSAYLVYIGDQNVAPTSDDVDLGDVRQSHALSAPGCMEAERKGLQRIMTAAGLVDIYRKFQSAPTA
jgi:exonuclease III